MDAAILKIDPPRHIALISKSPKVSAIDLAFIAAALQIQIRDHVCPIWKLAPIMVAAYEDGADLPADLAAVIYFVPSDGNPQSLGYHATIGGLVYGFVDVEQTLANGGSPSSVASHEAIEMVLNKLIADWIWIPSLRLWFWREGCDPVEDLHYLIDVTLFGETRAIKVADFVRPEYFDETATGPADYLNSARPLDASTGYQVAKTDTCKIVSLPDGSAAAAARVADKLQRTLSRTRRLVSLLAA